ncbi:hypothetical protein HF324_01865 [Chitinophaga oryzae]|uniref:Bacteriocin-type signal sequence-containing protein n=1 Tax=Chitinophaga oryzae TaxID=2725414 RepID=A0ABX6L9Q8_9BACT|nr:hypothetical protein [Chitinophaga oryzae]QJB36674.1 hypothetical protein HF324_01865 [Chitinophaga oryzae]
MEKFKLEETNQYPGEFLSREQLRNILGGTAPLTNPYCDGTETCSNGWKCADGTNSGKEDCEEATQWCINNGSTGVRCDW